MSTAAHHGLSLPEEFLLLAYLPSGGVRDLRQAEFGCAAAELAQLVLLRKLVIKSKKVRIFGFEAYQPRGDIRLLDAGRTGVAWADELLAALASQASPKRTPPSVPVGKWLSRRHQDAFALHRSALTSKGLLRGPSGQLPDSDEQYPDQGARHALADELRNAHSERIPFDERLRLLADLVDGIKLTQDLGLTLSPRLRMDWARSRGVMALLPEEIRDAGATLGSMIPQRRGSGAAGGDGGGDGGGE